MDVENWYQLTKTNSTTRDATSLVMNTRGYIILGGQVLRYRWMDCAREMSLLLIAHYEVFLEHVGTIRKLDLHSLFLEKHHYLARAKKVLILALQL